MNVFSEFKKRLDELGMSQTTLAKRSDVSLPTVNRILSGHYSQASIANVNAIAKALGMELTVEAKFDSEQFRQQQAMRKARRLVGLVQGTSALEGQGLAADEIERLVEQTFRELLPTQRKLWDE